MVRRLRSPALAVIAALAFRLQAFMVTVFGWTGATSRGTVLTTELNSLANGAFSAVGPAFDNTTNKDEYAVADFNLASLLPTTGGFLQLFFVVSIDGTTYEDPPSSTNPGAHMPICLVSLNVSTSTKRVSSKRFEIPPFKGKFVLKNAAGVALAASGNTVSISTFNEQAT
jgi:hypothetical protein